jgi:CRP-like cAMP-binding protein
METLEKCRTLAERVELFRGIRPDDVAKILAKGRVVNVRKGETLFYKGTTGNTMYVVLGGSVSLVDGKKGLALLRPGDTFGEMALISNEPRSATAIAAEDAKLFVLDETTFQRLMTKSVAIRMLLNIIATLSHRLRRANELLVSQQQPTQ